jgi:hypothetical protein
MKMALCRLMQCLTSPLNPLSTRGEGTYAAVFSPSPLHGEGAGG